MASENQWEAWGIIPARGGSKTIPLKNLVMLGGRPLIDYVIRAGQASKTLSRIICSTEHPQIATECHRMKIEVHHRPESLCRDDTPILDVLSHLLNDMEAKDRAVPEIIALLQPTSPFVLPHDIDTAVSLLRADARADSVQTLCTFPHNYHAYNQRVVENGLVRFRFPEERKECHNKQRKPTFYIFGNLIAARVRTITEQKEVFGARSLSQIIPEAYAVDVDGPEDLKKAEWLLASGQVSLPHIHA
jgi:CMP-N,N'-diacetyllegionaminic acid synthase